MNLTVLRQHLPKAINGQLDSLGLILQALMERSQRTMAAPASYATAGAQTYTAADILNGNIVRDCAGAARSDVLPTAALLVAAINADSGPGGVGPAEVGQRIAVNIMNATSATYTITIGAGTGGGWDTNQTAGSRIIPIATSRQVTIRLTNVTPGSEAYVAYM